MKNLFSLILALLPLLVHATSTSGTGRAVLVDGIVVAGGVAGSNGTEWETDELLQGVNGIINWYATWDDDSLYLGKTGGSNADRAVCYIHAGFTGAQLNPIGFNYGGLMPDFSVMTGVNFAASMDSGADEFTTWDGIAWAPVSNALVPRFSTQGAIDHMEVAIAWNDITAGNGQPDNFRLYMAQTAISGACGGNEVVYAESPWGTGVAGNGPTIAVNDGVPTSPQQPSGCSSGSAAITRWWGCYPALGGYGANSYIGQTTNAGPDTSICESASSYIMQAVPPIGTAIGNWSVLSQPGGSSPVTYSNANDPSAIAQNIDGIGVYVFLWTVSINGCPAVPDTMLLTRHSFTVTATTGPNQDLLCEVDTTTIWGNDPGPPLNGAGGTGMWTLISGQGSIADPTNDSTHVFNLGYGQNIFRWTITNGPCPSTAADIVVTRFQSVTADAGLDQSLCETTLGSLLANDPAAIGLSAGGIWSQLNGPSQVVFTNVLDFQTNISGLQTGIYDLMWTLTNGNCPADSDSVRIIVYDRPVADAGGDQTWCIGAPVMLDANDPAGVADSAFGWWTQLTGPSPATIGDTTQYNTTLSNLEDGVYKFSWTMTNGSCPPENDVIAITITELLDNGMSSIQSADQGQSNGSATVNPPQNGTSPYLYSLDGGPFQTSMSFDNLPAGIYIVTIQDLTGCEDTLQFEVKEIVPPPPPVDPDTLFIPTGFSPNGDGVNDTWEIRGLEQFPEGSIEVYNAWGSLIFRSNADNYSPWNGQYQGQDLPPANYYFIIDLKSPDVPVRKGSLTLFR